MKVDEIHGTQKFQFYLYAGYVGARHGRSRGRAETLAAG
jgi:hypothetical protein